MRILIACEFSGIVREAFRSKGHDAWSCDLLPTEIEGQHIQEDVKEIINDKWDMMIAHPPCTYLTNAGVRHLHENVESKLGVKAKIHGRARFEEMEKAAAFFNMLKNADIPKIAIENPIPHKYARELIGRYHQRIQPWEFGEPETKATCLWLKKLPPLMATIIETVRYARCHLMAPSSERWKERSRTYPGIAKAMAEQWG